VTPSKKTNKHDESRRHASSVKGRPACHDTREREREGMKERQRFAREKKGLTARAQVIRMRLSARVVSPACTILFISFAALSSSFPPCPVCHSPSISFLLRGIEPRERNNKISVRDACVCKSWKGWERKTLLLHANSNLGSYQSESVCLIV
jgi:hypothetical protein